MGDFNMVSLILGLASIAVGTLQPAVRYILISAREAETNSTPQQNQQASTVSVNVEPQIKYSSKPVQEKIKTPISPISFIKETSPLQE